MSVTEDIDAPAVVWNVASIPPPLNTDNFNMGDCSCAVPINGFRRGIHRNDVTF